MKLSKKQIIFIALCALTALWLYIIFSNSAQTGTESGEKSHSLTAFLNSVLAFFGIDASIEESFLRNLGHFGEYAALSLLLCLDLLFYPREDTPLSLSSLALSPVSLPLCFLVATFDEFVIQGSTEGRAPDWADVLTDTLGALTSLVLFAATLIIIVRIRGKRSQKT